jgi:2-aminoadipate transaminase
VLGNGTLPKKVRGEVRFQWFSLRLDRRSVMTSGSIAARGRTTESSASHQLTLSQKARRTGEPTISKLIEMAVGNPDLISLAAGLVDDETLPVELTLEACCRVLSEARRGRRALQYGTTRGAEELRELLADHLARLDRQAGAARVYEPGRIVVGTGSQQLLYLVAEALLDPGDIVLTAVPDYFVFISALQSFGAQLWGVPVDADGLIPEALDELFQYLQRQGLLARVKFLYCVSYFHNPTGVTLSGQRKGQILELLARWSRYSRLLVVEDAAYRELHCEQANLPPSFAALDEQGDRVVVAQTFSKPFAPGLKCGYAYLPVDLAEILVRQKSNHDFGSANFIQELLIDLLETGRYAEHVERLRKQYRAKRDLVLGTLDRCSPELRANLKWTRPGGGLYIWLQAPEVVDTTAESRFFRRCLERGVLYVPGEYCFAAIQALSPDNPLGGPRHTMRLSYGHCPLERLKPGMERLLDALREELRTG